MVMHPKGTSAAGLQELAVTSDHFEMGRMRKHLAQVWILEDGELEEPGREGWKKKRVRGLLIYQYSAVAWNLDVGQRR